MFYESQYRIDGREVDHLGYCRPSALLGFLQENGADAVAGLGLSHTQMLEKYHAFWMLARMWVELEAPIRWDDTLSIRTWHRPAKGVISYRDFDLYREGEHIGQAVSAWVLADEKSHKMLRLSTVREYAGSAGEGLGKTKTLSHLKLPEELTQAERRRLRYSEQDINGHINNTRYADYACDALAMERLGKGDFVRTMQIGFLAECHAGEELAIWTGERDGVSYVRGTGGDGKDRFEAAIALSGTLKEGN